MAQSLMTTVVDIDGEREVKREEPEKGEDVDMGDESSEQPSDTTVNETSTSGNKKQHRKTAAQLMVLHTAFDQDNSSPSKIGDRMNEICASTGLSADCVTDWFKHNRGYLARNAKKQEILHTAFRANPALPRKGTQRMTDIHSRTGLGAAAVRAWFANRSKDKHSSAVTVEARNVQKTAAQWETLLTAFQQDPSTPFANSVRSAELCASTGLEGVVIRDWFREQRKKAVKREKKQKSSDVNSEEIFGRKTAAQWKILLSAFRQDPSTPFVKSDRSAELCASTGLDARTINIWFKDQRRKAARKEKKQSPKNLKISHNVKPAESGSGGNSGTPLTDLFKEEKERGLVDFDEEVAEVADVEEIQDSEDNDSVVVENYNNNFVKDTDDMRVYIVPAVSVKIEPPDMDDIEIDNYTDTVSPVDFKFFPPAVFIACRDRENSDKGKPKQCALCLEDTPNDRITSIAEAAQFDAQFGSNLATFLRYCDSVMVCKHHLTDYYALMEIPRPVPVTTVSPRPTKCTICGGERLASVSIVSLKEAASLDEYHGSRVFDALHFSFAVKVCRVHREDLDRYQKAINSQQLQINNQY